LNWINHPKLNFSASHCVWNNHKEKMFWFPPYWNLWRTETSPW
jgi:hypothetical protein